MALSFPLSTAQFFDLLPVSRVKFRPIAATTTSQTGGGDVISHKIGARLWQGEIILDKGYHAELAAIDAKLSLLEEVGASFFIYDVRKPGPAGDPSGAGLANASPQIETLDANNRDLTLKGLPHGYQISDGDMLGFAYGAAPTRHAFHQVVTGSTANAQGKTGPIEVTPFIRPGASVDADVSLIKPTLKAKLLETEYGESRAKVSMGGSFAWIQTLR